MAIHSIRLFGDPVLRQQTIPIESVTSELRELLADLIETMHNAEGIGLAAPQIGRLERIFVVDVSALLNTLPEEDQSAIPKQPMVFINPEVRWESDMEVEFEEGCLSIPDIREPVCRPESVEIIYRDENMKKQSFLVKGILARVIQHEYDHLEGILFTDHISAFRRTFLKRKLLEISNGNVHAEYPIQAV